MAPHAEQPWTRAATARAEGAAPAPGSSHPRGGGGRARRRPHRNVVPDEDDERRRHGLATGRGTSLCCCETTTARWIRGIRVLPMRALPSAEIDLPGGGATAAAAEAEA